MPLFPRPRPGRSALRGAVSLTAAAVAASGLVAVAGPASATVSTCSSVNIGVTALHGPNFYIDSGITPQLMGAYAGYRVTNSTGSTKNDLWVKLTGFGGVVSLGAGQAASEQIASLTNTSAQSLFWYLTASAASGSAQAHTVQVWQGRPDLAGSTQLCQTAGSFASVQETIKAAANKLTSVSVAAGTPKIGQTVTVTVVGETGTVGAGIANDPSSFWMSPAATATWPADAYRLIGTNLSIGGSTYTDTLRVSGLTSANKAYTATYTFRAIGPTSSAATIYPVQQIASGTQIKHTDLNSVASLPAIPSPTNDLTLAKTASVASLPSAGGDVAYEVAVSGTAGAVLDDFTDTLPAGAALKGGTTVKWRGTTVSNAVVSGGVLTAPGPFTVTGTNDKLTYTLTLPATSGDRTNSVVAHVGAATVDASVSLTNDQPAGATVHVNAAPDAVNDTVAATQDVTATFPVLANDTDPEDDTLTVTGTTAGAHGTTSTDGTTVTYVPDSGYHGSDSFTYTVDDGNGGTDTATVSVTVNVPAALVLTDDTASATSGVPQDVAVTANDTGNAPITVTAASTPAHGTVSIVAGGTKVRYTPDAAYEGADSFTYDVSDATSQTGTATVNVTVTAPPPTATDDSADTDDASPVVVDVLGNDTGFGTLTVSAVGPPTHGTASDNGDGTVTYTPVSGQTGDQTFTYTVTDSAASPQSGTATVTVHVSAAPSAGDPVDDEATVAWDGSEGVLVDVLANDPDGATLDTVGTPSHGTAAVEGTEVRYTPSGTFAGTDTFTYTVSGSATAATVTVDVTPPDLEAVDDEVTAEAGGTPVTVDVLANDTGNGLSVSDVDATTAEGNTAAVVDGQVVVTPADGFRGDDTLQYEVTDVVDGTSVATITVHVPNAVPTVNDPAARQVVAGGSTNFALTVGDDDPDDTPAVTTGTPTGSANAATRVTASVSGSGTSRTVRVTAHTAFSGTVDIPVTVDDGHEGGTATTTLHLTVSPRAATGVQAGVVGNPGARSSITRPTFDAKGNPVSKTLSDRIDSRITWQVSPTTSVVRYDVRVNGTIVCQPAAQPLATTQSCTLAARALRTTDVVTVTAIGRASTTSVVTTVPVARPTGQRHLLAVVYFPVGDFRLDATARAVLADVDAKAVAYGMRTVRLEGHTDSDGSTTSNQTLSENRSRQVGQWLVDNDSRVRVSTAGFGELVPAMTNTSVRNKAANRRVEIFVGD